MFSDFFFTFLIYSSLSHQLISADDKTNDPLMKDESQTLAFRNIDHLEFKFNKNTSDRRPQLECEEELHKNRLCEKYKVLNATCSNLNYQKKDFADWRCDFNLHFHVSVYYQQLNCEYVNRTSNDLPLFFRNDSCHLTYRLELNKNHVKSFKETPYINFIKEETVKGHNKLICGYKDFGNEMLCNDYFYKSVNCTNLNFEKDDFPKWECDLKPLSPRVITGSNPEIRCEYIKLPDQKKSYHYLKNSCSLKYKISLVQKYVHYFFDTPFLKFDLNLNTEGANPKPQLQCNKESIFELCKNFNITSVNCTNLDFEKLYDENWECDFKSLNPDLEAFNESINCNTIESFSKYYTKFEIGSCYLTFSLKYSREYGIPFRDTKFLEFRSDTLTASSIPKTQLECEDQSDSDFCLKYYARSMKCKNLNFLKANEPLWNCDDHHLNSNFKIKSDYKIDCDLPRPFYFKKNSCQLRYKLELNSESVKEFKKTSFLTFRSYRLTKGDNPTSQLKCKEAQHLERLCVNYSVKRAGCENLNYNKEMNAPKWRCSFSNLDPNVNASLSDINCTLISTRGIPLYYQEGTCYLEYDLKLKQINKKEKNVPKESNKANPNLPLYIIIVVLLFIVLLVGGICCKFAKAEFTNRDSNEFEFSSSDDCKQNCANCLEKSCKFFLCFHWCSSLSNRCSSSSSDLNSISRSTSGLASTSSHSVATSGIANTSFR